VPVQDRVYKVGADGSEKDEAEQRPATIYALDGELLILRKPDFAGQFEQVRPRRHEGKSRQDDCKEPYRPQDHRFAS